MYTQAIDQNHNKDPGRSYRHNHKDTMNYYLNGRHSTRAVDHAPKTLTVHVHTLENGGVYLTAQTLQPTTISNIAQFPRFVLRLGLWNTEILIIEPSLPNINYVILNNIKHRAKVILPQLTTQHFFKTIQALKTFKSIPKKNIHNHLPLSMYETWRIGCDQETMQWTNDFTHQHHLLA